MVRSNYSSSRSNNPPTHDENAAKKFAFESASAFKQASGNPKKIAFRRCGKSCRVKKTDNHLTTKYENFTSEEEDLIIKMHAAMGSRWPLIAQQIPGKTEEDVKMFWNSKLKKKLSEMGIDPVTHRPFSYILAEYGNINGGVTLNPNSSNHSRSLNQIDESHHQNQQSDESGDLLFHLQAIKFMTESSSSNQFKPEMVFSDQSIFMYGSSMASSSSSSSPPLLSSNVSTIVQETSEVNFTWSDFLLDQETFIETPQEVDNNEFSMAATMANRSIESVKIDEIEEESSSNGFVDSIIAKEQELFLGFPNNLDQPFHF